MTGLTAIFYVFFSPVDGKRCADTLQSLFDNAADPDNIIVGIIEQNAPEDRYCLEEYCSRMGVNKHYRRQAIRKDVTKIIVEPERLKCPRFNQVRQLAFHNRSAKGPLYARSMTRKILGNEEFCMQVDAHSSFRKNWDQIAKENWRNTNNEFAVISHVPGMQGEQPDHEDSGALSAEVPRQCKVKFQDNGVPVRCCQCICICADDVSHWWKKSLTHQSAFFACLIELSSTRWWQGCRFGQASFGAYLVVRF